MSTAAAALRDKYERMRALRAAAEGGGDEAATRAELRALAAAWPGALKELDTLPTAELERRAALCATGGGGEPWMAWMLRYHELMRAALAVRRGEATASAAGGAAIDEEFVRAVKRPAHGRLNVVVFAALAREFGIDARTMWDTLFPRRGKMPRAYR